MSLPVRDCHPESMSAPQADDWLGVFWLPGRDLDPSAGELDALPTSSGVYRVWHPDDDELVYVGRRAAASEVECARLLAAYTPIKCRTETRTLRRRVCGRSGTQTTQRLRYRLLHRRSRLTPRRARASRRR